VAVYWKVGHCGQDDADPQLGRFVDAIIREVAELRLPDLQAVSDTDVLYRQPERHGVSVVALRTTSLRESQLIGLLKYRMAQYLLTGFFDPSLVYRRRLTHEPLAEVAADDVHVVATSAQTGEVLCYAVLRSVQGASPGTTLRSAERPLLPLERAHGRGIFNRLCLLPDLPLAKVREIGRFVKNQQRGGFDELHIRSPIEVGLALFRTVTGPLRSEVQAVVGSFQEAVAKRNLDYFHIPLVVIRGTVPCAEEHSVLGPRYRDCATYPFAVLVADLDDGCGERLAAIEEALSRQGHDGMLALLALKDHDFAGRSSLEPTGGLAPLSATGVDQAELSTDARRQLRDLGQLLRATRAFRGLSDGEAAVLATFMEHVGVAAGDVLIREGEIGDDLFVVASGEAEVRMRNHARVSRPVARLGAGDYFGEISLVTGGARSADVVALTPMTILKATRELYGRYLAHMVEVELELTRTAASRLRCAWAAREVV
jgi:hypothetical protein